MTSIVFNVLALTFMMSIGNVHNFDYCKTKLGNDNTMCKYKDGKKGGNCGEEAAFIPMTDSDKTKILKKHNELRSKVAQGKENRGEDGAQPAAANMMKLVWDEELEEAAKRWALQCIDEHDKAATSKFDTEVGQNFGFAPDTTPTWDATIDLWYNEVTDFPSKSRQSYPDTRGSGDLPYGHYSQVVWAKTHSIGCAAMLIEKSGSGKVHMFCNYGPSGSVPGDPVYIEGDAGTQCPEGSKADSNSGLCV